MGLGSLIRPHARGRSNAVDALGAVPDRVPVQMGGEGSVLVLIQLI